MRLWVRTVPYWSQCPKLRHFVTVTEQYPCLKGMGIDDVKVVINRVRSDMIDKGIMMNMDDCVDMLGVPVLGIVPDDEELMVAALKGTLAVSAENSRAGQAFLNIAARLMAKKCLLWNLMKRKAFLIRLKSFSENRVNEEVFL